jgi:hypothetical protein
VNARFLAVRHGIRFEVTLHTTESFEAKTAHAEYMRRKFATVIKTDLLFAADGSKVTEVKQQMRREDMWRERWARIGVPDRALTIGTLRYAHLPIPSRETRLEDALSAVGQSRAAMHRLQSAVGRVQLGVRLGGRSSRKGGGQPAEEVEADEAAEEEGLLTSASGHTSLHSRSFSDKSEWYEDGGGVLGSAWTQIASAFIRSDRKLHQRFVSFRQSFVRQHGADRRLVRNPDSLSDPARC